MKTTTKSSVTESVAEITKREWLLIFISISSANGENYTNSIIIPHCLFLFKMRFGEWLKSFYHFVPDLAGADSIEIYEDLITLQEQGLINEDETPLWVHYSLTERGKFTSEQCILRHTNENIVNIIKGLEEIKKQLAHLSFLDVFNVVYNEHPGYASESVSFFNKLA
jgi:DNA-binding HxlR family transcriptional regulator